MGKFTGTCANRGVTITREQEECTKNGRAERVAHCKCGLHVFMERRSTLCAKAS